MLDLFSVEHPLILASGSPRRKEICEMLGWKITVCPAKTEKAWNAEISEEQSVLEIAKAKAEEVFLQYPDSFVLGSDTVVLAPVKEGWQVLGKPKDREDAKRMLSMLSGKTHRVLTGVWICSLQKCDGFVSENLVTFQAMSEEEIEAYIATGEPMDKAGAYGIQGEGGRYIAKLEGDFYAVMGLPREQLKQFVEENFQK